MDTPTKRTLIACSMMEDEISQALRQTGLDLPVVWMDRGYHNTPEELRRQLQCRIDLLQDQNEILLAFGLCGNGTDGLCSPHTRLILPRFDDCVNLMLCTGERASRALTRSDSLYLTRGWIQDEESILQQYEKLKGQYDEEMLEIILDTMYEHYRTVTVIDTGCFELKPVLDYARRSADLLGLETDCVPGSNRILQKLLRGDWDEDFIILEPGIPVEARCFNFIKNDGNEGKTP